VINAADIDPIAVLDRYGVDHDGEGEVRFVECPSCGHRSKRGAASFNIDNGLGRCFHCKVRWNTYQLLQALEGADDVTPIVKELVGDDPKRIEQSREQREERRVAARSRRARQIAEMPTRWRALEPRHAGGEAYLREERGIESLALPPGVVRYTRAGWPSIAVRDLETGAIVGYQSRRILPCIGKESKVTSCPGSKLKGSALHGRLADLDPDGCDVAVLVEGLMDSAAAILAFPTCAVFGAAGWEHMGTIAAALAPRVKAMRGWLVLVPHDDDAGADGAADAMRAAANAGLTIADDDAGLDGASSLRLLDLGPYNDLAEAWRAGIRWIWPGRRAA
jgi:hypothetical protein